jgi:cyclase|tara:strand:+ start:1752 stop:2528 length:777 start_codon:yes stop_codon:yes gene_type:complete
MLTRLIPVLYFKNGSLVRSQNFDIHQILGDPFIQVEKYNSWNVDEIIYLDISKYQNLEIKNKTQSQAKTFLDVIRKASKKSFSPIVFGGGIKNLADAKIYFQNGADKISINSACIENINIISELANIFGSQSIVVSIDIKKIGETYRIYDAKKDLTCDYDLISYVKDVEKKGAGEILLNSVDRDGAGNGYDTKLIKLVFDAINIPLIPCGGVGNLDHFVELLEKINTSAVAAGNIFNFTERSYEKAKIFLKEKKLNFR